jgi:hypothetical protein
MSFSTSKTVNMVSLRGKLIGEKGDQRRVTSKAILPPHIGSAQSKINLINSGKQELYFGNFF